MYYYYVWSRVYYYILDSHARDRESPLFTRYISGEKPSVCCVYLKCPIHETYRKSPLILYSKSPLFCIEKVPYFVRFSGTKEDF